MSKPKQIQRRIEYFKITAKGGDNGLFGDKLKQLSSQLSSHDREFEHFDSSVNFNLIDSDDGLIRGAVFQSRSTAPSKRKMGAITTTPVELDDDEGIDEKTHFIYCPERSYVCIEYNYHGPKLPLIVRMINKLYSKHIDKDAVRSGYSYIQAGNAVDMVINHSERVRSVQAKLVNPKTVAPMNEQPDLPDVFDSFKPPKETVVEVKIKGAQRGSTAMSISKFKSFILRNRDDLQYYDTLKVEAVDETGKTVPYDLIKDKMADTVTVPYSDGTKEISSAVIFEKMDSLFEDMKSKHLA
jgi:hypothetical protein